MLSTLILTLLLVADGPAFLYEDSATDQAIRQTMHATYSLQLAEARGGAQALELRYPDHPIGFVLFAETYWWEAQMDPGNKSIENAYYKAQALAVDKAERAMTLRKYPSIEVTASLASAWGSYARFQLTQKRAYFSALRSGLKAHKYAEQVYEMDRNSYDIWVGIGAFNYFTGSLPAVIKPFAWLIGARGDRELGLEQLRTSIERSRYSQTEGRIVYYTALLEDKQFAVGFPILDKLMSDYPENFVIYVWVAEWYRVQHKEPEGIHYFEQMYQTQITQSPRMAGYALLEKARLQSAMNLAADARLTTARIRAILGAISDPLLNRTVQAFERTLK